MLGQKLCKSLKKALLMLGGWVMGACQIPPLDVLRSLWTALRLTAYRPMQDRGNFIPVSSVQFSSV